MEYRGKPYTIVQGIQPGSWKWKVKLHEGGVKSGDSPTREAARVRVVWMIDQALAQNKRKRGTRARLIDATGFRQGREGQSVTTGNPPRESSPDAYGSS